ncbi:hypothetical protein R3P38DRAFT_3183513 [Favolaschia claudopus]|uniref:Uncharacterized protein n=1 Tax=Favolaschia claudopus TaxID=2862362 RepID=A0AAW0C9L7_9AGAR
MSRSSSAASSFPSSHRNSSLPPPRDLACELTPMEHGDPMQATPSLKLEDCGAWGAFQSEFSYVYFRLLFSSSIPIRRHRPLLTQVQPPLPLVAACPLAFQTPPLTFAPPATHARRNETPPRAFPPTTRARINARDAAPPAAKRRRARSSTPPLASRVANAAARVSLPRQRLLRLPPCSRRYTENLFRTPPRIRSQPAAYVRNRRRSHLPAASTTRFRAVC